LGGKVSEDDDVDGNWAATHHLSRADRATAAETETPVSAFSVYHLSLAPLCQLDCGLLCEEEVFAVEDGMHDNNDALD